MNRSAPARLIYLDNAATSYPKPPAVVERVATSMTERGGNPGRGSHALALAAAEEIYACRALAADFFGISAHPECVIFTLNTTHALNLAIKGMLGEGDHAICSDMEHNSVLRPLYRLQTDGRITFDVFDTYPAAGRRDSPTAPRRSDGMILSSLASRITPKTKAVICAHASNLCGATLPIERIGAFCHARGIKFIVDAAQSAGVLGIDMTRMHIDALCVPGHKGLMGPQGTGMLILGEGITLDTLMEGGNGMDSLSGEMSLEAPERYEAGTLAAPAIAGLRTGMEYVREVGVERIYRHEATLGGWARDGLMALPRVTVYAPRQAGGVVLFSVDGYDSEDVGRMLDAEGICVRPGFHCSALGHRTLGTPEGGAVRASFGWFNREEDVDALLRAMRRIVG